MLTTVWADGLAEEGLAPVTLLGCGPKAQGWGTAGAGLQLWAVTRGWQADVCTSGRQSRHLPSSMKGVLQKRWLSPKTVLVPGRQRGSGQTVSWGLQDHTALTLGQWCWASLLPGPSNSCPDSRVRCSHRLGRVGRCPSTAPRRQVCLAPRPPIAFAPSSRGEGFTPTRLYATAGLACCPL